MLHMYSITADSEVCFLFSLSPEQMRLKELSSTSLQPISKESLPDTVKHIGAPLNVLLYRSSDQDSCMMDSQADTAGSQQERRIKGNIQADPRECDQGKRAAPIRPCRKKDSSTLVQQLGDLFVKPIPEVISVQVKMKNVTCEIPSESAINPTHFETNQLETKEKKPITSRSEEDMKHVEHPTIPIIKKRHLTKQSSNIDKETAALDSNVSNEEFVQPIKFCNTAMEDLKEPRQPVGNTSTDAYCITVKGTEDVLRDEQKEQAKETNSPVPRPRVKKCLHDAFTDNYTSTLTASQTIHNVKVQTEGGGFSSVLSTSDQLSLVEQCKEHLMTESSVFMAGMRCRLTDEKVDHAEFKSSSEKIPKASSETLSKERTRNHLSDLFPDVQAVSDSTPPPFSDNSVDSLNPATPLESKNSVIPVPLHQTKRVLKPTHLPHVHSLIPTQIELSQTNSDYLSVPFKENSLSLHSSVISDKGSDPILGEDAVLKLEMEVLEAMQDVFTLSQSLEDTPEVPVQTFEGPAFTNEPDVNESETSDFGNVPEQDIDGLGTITVPSPQDDWLHIEPKKGNELLEISPRMEMKDDEFDFGFVSVNVASTDCSENQR